MDFELGGKPDGAALAGADALVHCAYDFRPARWADVERVNIEGSRLLFAAARQAGVQRIVLISTVAAFPGARSRYGRAKLALERAASDAGAAIVRPGLVWGENGAATFGALQRVVGTLPVMPLPVPAGLDIWLAHERDLALFVERVLDSWPAASKQVLVAASPQRVAFSELLRSLALHAGGRPRFMRVPWRAAWLGLRALEALGSSPTLRSDSLLSLATADSNPLVRATDRPERYGVRFDPYPLDPLGGPVDG